MEKKLLFALDIGTRSVVGLVGEQTETAIRLLATERHEHHTRAMLDGQIHDVPEVASALEIVKSRLEESCGPLKKVSVAAAGRALCTITCNAEIEVQGRGLLTIDDEQTLELSAIQAAQHQLATSDTVSDPTSYYCVGYSVVHFILDGTILKTLVGQRGKSAGVELIVTFLPRQVIDSLQSALLSVDLEMDTLTLEPIAAISILIPPTMRHLNLALVDIGAGTSDVAITREGSVVGYGMVPCAGDEITEAISQQYLLDFNIAEEVKRQLSGKHKKITFTDILGAVQKIPASDIIAGLSPHIAELAQAIAGQILTLNKTAPQAVLLVGGGSLTPMLPETLAQALDIPASRVAIRRPDAIEDIVDIPEALCMPDAVTPLGILKLSGSRALNFVNVTLNDQALHLFNLGQLTIADALLSAGIHIRNLQSKPGLGITVSVNGQTQFIPGSHGKPGSILLNGSPATYTDRLNEDDIITVTKGTDGTTPIVTLGKVVELPEPLPVSVNGTNYQLPPLLSLNDAPAEVSARLSDRDKVTCRLPKTLAEVLTLTKTPSTPRHYTYTINGIERTYSVWPKYTVDGVPAAATTSVQPNNAIQTVPAPIPTLQEILGLADPADDSIQVTFNGTACSIPLRRYQFTVNGQPARLTDKAPGSSAIQYTCLEQPTPMISDVLLAAEFDPHSLPTGGRVEIRLNGHPTEYTALVSSGDAIDISIVANEVKTSVS